MLLFPKLLRFIAAKGERPDPGVMAQMKALEAAATQIEDTGTFEVAGAELAVAARAFAGVAAFLQQQILPEAVADGNAAGERQVRWAVDQAMEIVNLLLCRAAETPGEPVTVVVRPSA